MHKAVAAVAGALIASALLAVVANADGDPPYRRTTPRGSFGRDGPDIVIGVPGGRAWGIESALVRVPDERTAFRAMIEVRDPDVREAFVRVAWYERATGRPRQFALTDTRLVGVGETATLVLALEPPPGAVAYRLRVLARLRAPDAISSADAIRVTLPVRTRRPGPLPPTRLLP